MAANDALIASLLLGQRQKRDPLEIYQSFGRDQIKAGSSTAPLGSGNALEGIARALQGGLGGLIQGYGIGEQREQDAGNLAALTQASTEKSSEGIAKALSGIKGNSELMIPMLGQIIQGRLNDTLAQEQAGKKLVPLGLDGPPQVASAAPAAASGQGSVSTAQLPPGAFANNSGNIRATPLPWEGKGAPQNGFETFATPQAGANAQFKNFAAYVQQNPNMTVAQALAKWAPPTENDTGSYVRTISEATGINPGMPLADVLKDPVMAAQLLDAQTRLEKGGMPQGFSADTFIAAAGGPQAAPGTPGPVAAPPAQGSGGTAMAQPGPPTALSSPAGDQLRQRAQAAQQAGDNVTALAYAKEAAQKDAEWATEVGKKNLDQTFDASEWDRRQKATTAAGQPQQAFSNESKLRGEFESQPAIKSYNTVVPILAAARQAGKTRAGDLNLIYAFAKLMDPDSVVRESETGAVVATQSVMDRIGAYVGQLNGQQMLNDEARAKLMAELNGRFGELQKSRDALAQQYGGIASAHGLAPDRVVTSVRPPESAAPPPAAPPPSTGAGVSDGATATNPQTGQKIIMRGGQWVPAQ